MRSNHVLTLWFSPAWTMATLEPDVVESDIDSTGSSTELSTTVQSDAPSEPRRLRLYTDPPTVLEKAKLRFSPRLCRLRWVTSKGAVLILLWNCLIADNNGPLSAITAGILGLDTDNKLDGNRLTIVNNVIQGVSYTLFYPFAGWIADVYFGRYKVIHSSLFLMCAGVVAITACLCLQLVTGASLLPLQYSISPIALLAVQFGVAGFKANAIPLGTDQLVEGSGNELSGYIHWYIVTIFINIRVLSIPFFCFVANPDYALLFQLLVQVTSLSLALGLDFCFNHWLIIDPGSVNPFKLIYQVLNYARKNRHARFRSAFTYYMDEPPSRMEITKHQYGGPFTAEEVEDVKTFFRMLSVVIPMALVFFMQVVVYESDALIADYMPSNLDCVTKDILGREFHHIVIIMLLPFYEFFLYPFLHNLMPNMLMRAGIGTVFVVAAILSQLAIEVVGHVEEYSSLVVPSINMSNESTCAFAADAVSLGINLGWNAVPNTFLALSILFQFVALNEFVFAQAPYSMKGLFIGLIYGIQGLYQLVILFLQLPFLLGAADTSLDFPTCGFFYFLMNVVISVVALIWYSCAAWKYKTRQRESPDSYQVFTEDYFDKYLRYRHK